MFIWDLKPDHLNLCDNLSQLRDAHLRWTIAGVINKPSVSHTTVQYAKNASIDSIYNVMHQFWMMEQVPNAYSLPDDM